MAVLAKPINRIAVIKEKESQKFVREFNENKVSIETSSSHLLEVRLFTPEVFEAKSFVFSSIAFLNAKLERRPLPPIGA